MKALAEKKERSLSKMYNKRSKKLKAFLSFSLTLAFLSVFFLFHAKVYADGINYLFKVEQNISINSPYSKPQDNFDYILEPITKDAPLPEGSSGSYKFTLKSDDEKEININYQKAGEYKYKLYQLKTDIQDVDQDKEIYIIYIKITEKDGQLVQDKVFLENSSDKKVEEMNFHNKYYIETESKNEEPNKAKDLGNLDDDIDGATKIKTNKLASLANVRTGIKENFILIILIMLVAINLFILTNKGRDKEKVEKN